MFSTFPSLLIKFFLLACILVSFVTITCARIIGDIGHSPSNSSTYKKNELRAVGLGMVERKGNQFVLGGQPFYVNGFNTYWLMTFAAEPSTRGKVTETFEDASTVGFTVCRTWAFSDGGSDALQKSPSVYDENIFRGLDFVVSEAKKHNIKLILSLTNNWSDYGGKAQYVNWGKAAGLELNSDDDFFINPTVKDYYKAHIKTVLTRVNTITNIAYKDDPTIFAWELMNEARCPSDGTGNDLQSWIEEMAQYVKSIDPNHLLEVGLEGFYRTLTPPTTLEFDPKTFGGQTGTDFIRNHQAPGIDFATAHIYPDTWVSNSIPGDHIEFVNSWMQSHIDDAENVLKMPVLFTEFGESSRDNNFSVSFRDQFLDTVYANILKSTGRGGSAAGGLVWQLYPQGTDYMDDGYAIVLSKYKSTADILSAQSKRIQLLNSRCSWSCGSQKCNWICRRE